VRGGFPAAERRESRFATDKGGRVPTWLLVLIIILVILALFGGFGYYRR
jgi:hypothetical protein